MSTNVTNTANAPLHDTTLAESPDRCSFLPSSNGGFVAFVEPRGVDCDFIVEVI